MYFKANVFICLTQKLKTRSLEPEGNKKEAISLLQTKGKNTLLIVIYKISFKKITFGKPRPLPTF